MVKKRLPNPSRNNQQVREYVSAVKRGLNDQYVVATDKGWSVRRASASRASGISTQRMMQSITQNK